ncbi:ThiF family adenylyltransferase [Streptomyces tsukubensis]|uniref:THIF-type NAD/FAD binding fold domain-containing protein n=1 Tax=Streptomyces tsukubensis TaxID=83656 RepID=A0A1V4ADC6_9ACTN|nr:ThiF family adenylyltransferase [Streptomyces tsukubensis]OON81265.1 hypothetical protein B1H18_07850 [Streptomyces tsukubensis]QFR95624.1 ThiF family adenylyltransferase [Streptomyces tsukubensis]
MHPILKPALRRAWRDLQTVQFGVAPAHAKVLGPVDMATSSFLHLLDGTRGLPLLREEGRRAGLPQGHVDHLVGRLSEAGLVDDATGGGPEAEALRECGKTMDRLRPDLASLSLLSTAPGEAMGRLAARRRLRVQVRGAGRVGAMIASLLAGAGIGRIEMMDGGCVEPWDVAPGGLPADSVGLRRVDAARRMLTRAAPGRPPRGAFRSPAETPAAAGYALVVFAPRDGLEAYAPAPANAESLLAPRTPHLYAGVLEGTGMVGPLVLPGVNGCAGCLSLGRAEKDPAWPRMLAQWRSGRARQAPACDLTVAAAVAGLAASHALAFLDGRLPASAGSRWEAALPAGAWRSWPVAPHTQCVCGATDGGKREEPPGSREPQDTMAL